MTDERKEFEAFMRKDFGRDNSELEYHVAGGYRHGSVDWCWEGWQAGRAPLLARIRELEADAARYQQLIMAVGKKWPGESRHDTALKYISRAEVEVSTPAKEAIKEQSK